MPHPDRLLTQGDIERQIMTISDELAEETERYAAVSDLAAESEADYKGAHARATILIANDARSGDRMTVNEREAIAHDRTSDAFRSWKINEARRAASREALLSLRSRIDALRTLAANVRVQT